MKRLLGLIAAVLISVPCYAANPPIPAGSTGNAIQCIALQVRDTSVTTKYVGLTGLTSGTSGLGCYSFRNTANASVLITLANGTLGTWSSGNFKEVDAVHKKGEYQLCLPNAAVAVGADHVTVTCDGATNMEQTQADISLTSPNTFGYDGQLTAKSTTTLTLASGAVPADGAFAYQDEIVFVTANGLVKYNSCIVNSTAASNIVVTAEDISAGITVGDNYIIRPNGACRGLRPTTSGRTLLVSAGGNSAVDWGQVSNPTTTVALTGTTISTAQTIASAGSVTGNVGGNVVGSVGSVTGNVSGSVGSVVGNIGGSVASVTGAVGSVTGNVGGNVVGSVGSVSGSVAGSVASVTGAVGSVTGNVGGNVTGTVGAIANGGLTGGAVAQSFLAKFFTTDSGQSYGSSIAGSIVKEIAANAGGGGGGTCNGYWNINTLQSIISSTVVVASNSEKFQNGDLVRGTGLLIYSASGNAGAGAGQYRCVKTASNVTKRVTLCNALQTIPSGAVQYTLLPDAACNCN